MKVFDFDAVEAAFDRNELVDICEREQSTFEEFGERWEKLKDGDKRDPEQFYFFKDNGSSILGIAHLDNVCKDRTTSVMDMHMGPLVYSGALDDRLGAYVILKMLPKLGITVDWLLTTNEEIGQSTAKIFVPPDKKYNWIFSFDRKGTDVVMYDYETPDYKKMVEEYDVKVNKGSFSDICCLKNLDCMGMNWGVGYRDYHGPMGHAFLVETFEMVSRFAVFHADHSATHYPYVPFKWTPLPKSTYPTYGGSKHYGSDWWGDGYHGNRAKTILEEVEGKKGKRGRGRSQRPLNIYDDGSWEVGDSLDPQDVDDDRSVIAQAWEDWKLTHPVTMEDVNDGYYLKMCPVCDVTLDEKYVCPSCAMSPHEWYQISEDKQSKKHKKSINPQKVGEILKLTESGLTTLTDDTPPPPKEKTA